MRIEVGKLAALADQEYPVSGQRGCTKHSFYLVNRMTDDDHFTAGALPSAPTTRCQPSGPRLPGLICDERGLRARTAWPGYSLRTGSHAERALIATSTAPRAAAVRANRSWTSRDGSKHL